MNLPCLGASINRVDKEKGTGKIDQIQFIVYLENAWSSKQMITEGEAAILLETTRRAFRNQSQSKQRSTLNGTILETCSWFGVLILDTLQVHTSSTFVFQSIIFYVSVPPFSLTFIWTCNEINQYLNKYFVSLSIVITRSLVHKKAYKKCQCHILHFDRREKITFREVCGVNSHPDSWFLLFTKPYRTVRVN